MLKSWRGEIVKANSQPVVRLKLTGDWVQDATNAAAVLKADGVATRKRKAAPEVTNQQWPDLVKESEAIIAETAIRLQELERLITSPHSLYARDLPDLYKRRMENLGFDKPRLSIGAGESPRIFGKAGA